eukprot:NODE_6739_length_487_cov_189.738426.p1 GENE.NODE_6739_length_487_cov_189.738426~~NODE_6739_length_487_cov_189.738426.p1  ORF type:complete len:98 (+),score=16.30 NODE_6739_length_487_cov_189.738426:3-296(+)
MGGARRWHRTENRVARTVRLELRAELIALDAKYLSSALSRFAAYVGCDAHEVKLYSEIFELEIGAPGVLAAWRCNDSAPRPTLDQSEREWAHPDAGR